MKIISGSLTVATLCLITAVPAHAGHYDAHGRNAFTVHFDSLDTARYADDLEQAPRIKKRIHRQHRRIAQGIKSKQLTRKQTKVLIKKHRKLRKVERKFAKDGYYSEKEKRILARKLNKNSKRIRRFKQDCKYTSVNWRPYYQHNHHKGHARSHWKDHRHHRSSIR